MTIKVSSSKTSLLSTLSSKIGYKTGTLWRALDGTWKVESALLVPSAVAVVLKFKQPKSNSWRRLGRVFGLFAQHSYCLVPAHLQWNPSAKMTPSGLSASQYLLSPFIFSSVRVSLRTFMHPHLFWVHNR